ncbi:uncharacterized protein [Antedon mediterranea]|uniref:uncharacterized protein n=1 Tax=Antedon mediterranea TaxID=105859 RepID=UPI003AF8A450
MLSNCEAFILYSNNCDLHFDGRLCEFVHPESDTSLLQINCCPGYTGTDCYEECPENMFGLNCLGNCECQNGATCNPINGSCTCPDGYTGEFCERTCTEGLYGGGCLLTCPDCHTDSYCDHTNGSCICPPKLEGELCSEKQKGNPDFCSFCPPSDVCGEISCCDSSSDFCLCGPGWTGIYCTEPCEVGTFGKNCKKYCECENNSTCLHTDGRCICTQGWTGTLCNEPCESGFFGNQCFQMCNCPNNSTCDHITGACHCAGDWQGMRCNEGIHCKPNENCRPANGTCIADVETISKRTPPIKSGIAAGAGATTFLCLVVLTIYCMKRTKVQSRTFSMERKVPISSNGPQPPPRPGFATFNNEPVYDSIGEDGHYIEIIDNKPSGIYNPEYIISGGEGYLIPSTRPTSSEHQDTSSSGSNYSTDSS